jgi:flagellar motor switch protein FliN/FliY
MALNDAIAAGLQGASATGTELLGKPVEISLRSVQQGGWDLAAGLKGFTLGCPVAFGQDLSGSGIILLDARHGALIAELMLGNDPAELPAELPAALKDAAAEAISQMVGAMGEALGRASRRKVQASAGELTALSGDGASAARGVVAEDRIMVGECELKIGTHPPARLVLVLAGSHADTLGAAPAAAGPDIVLGPSQAAGPGGAQRVQPVQFGTIQAPPSAESQMPSNLDLLLDVPLEVTVELGRATRKVRDVLALGPGSIVELNKLAGEPVDMLVNGKLIAKGEVVVIDENFAVRIIEILSREERLSGGL